ncbi:ABC transporter permease [Lysinibacter sp. HNR]|uniref:ABC transporter permease n=1 Tax=Lysinibacter sp. HNR TaxID=3031408 RepID=UPI002434DB8B|nr:ABC transporter permease [Lysinibacter sp. HNR]WGD36367.1 ABC transporter permease [Lysinibacter sp. HNR]
MNAQGIGGKKSYAVRRLVSRFALRMAALFVVIWGAVTLAFFAIKLVPGDPVDVMLGPHSQVGPEERALIRTDLGLDYPLWQQYLLYIGRLLRGDLGMSYQLRQPVSQVIGSQLGATVQLSVAALLCATLLVLLGAVIGRTPWLRGIVGTIELVAVSAPVFWSGLILLSVFSFGLGWFPVAGSQGIPSLVLPALTIAIPVSAVIGQVLRRGIESAEKEPFVETVLSRGVAPSRLLTHHTLRHAANGTLTLGAYVAGSLMAGAVLVESIFGRPGLGRVTLSAILARDLPVVLGVVLFIACIFVVINTIVDVVSEIIDPRLARATVSVRGSRP